MREGKRVRRRSRGAGFGHRVEREHSAIPDKRPDMWEWEVSGNITHYEGSEFVRLGRGLGQI